MGNVFIIGNGFDLDLGLPTKYSDFAKSEYWPKSAPRYREAPEETRHDMEQGRFLTIPVAPKLEHAIEDAKIKNTWFDLEKELLDYAKLEQIKTSSNELYRYVPRYADETPNEIDDNVNYISVH